jgi:crotonobetainyl-CoA:carnitine CoA-transferase CaiB-like acyl-CoA transferase
MNVNYPEEIFKDKHLKDIDFFKVNNHPTEGKLLYPSFPVDFNTGKDNKTIPAPNLGEHTEEILSELGYSNSEIKKLFSDGVIKLSN